MDVVLIDIANDPLTKLYGAYRTCYTPKTPREVWDDIAAGTVTREKIAQFVEERLEYVMHDSWRDAGRAAEFEKLMEEITRVYREAVAAGIPAEDARFVLPNAAPTNFQI